MPDQITKQLTPIQEKRELLKKYSAFAAPFVENGDYETINQAIVAECYTNKKHKEFKTFKQWLKDGFSVKKGEKAFLVWGRPKDTQDKEAGKEPEPNENEKAFFPIAFVFSNAQVEPKKGDKKNV